MALPCLDGRAKLEGSRRTLLWLWPSATQTLQTENEPDGLVRWEPGVLLCKALASPPGSAGGSVTESFKGCCFVIAAFECMESCLWLFSQ